MRKNLLSLVTAGLFVTGLLLIYNSASATAVVPPTWKTEYMKCAADQNIQIRVCAAGSDESCTPWGSCP
ncbi:hypothetical protein [Paraflavitalea soli]|uniref:hypothetical protein n=1 Tax=Paraflavitalea soli TaxID=2315862 RepID=UPI0013C40C2E|nr:hypothetical protein [Paraflavitalea soli]